MHISMFVATSTHPGLSQYLYPTIHKRRRNKLIMERLLTTKVAIIIVVVVAVHVLNAGPSSGQYCGLRSDGGWTPCDAGTCCGTDNYCSTLGCSPANCQYYCNSPDQTQSTVAGLGGAAAPVLQVLASRKHYLDREIDAGVVGHRKPNNVNASSSSLSCATSLSRLSPAARQRYPWAALGGGVVASRNGNNITTAICGQCLKVTTAGAGGEVDTQVLKVRIAHTTTAIEGLELDRDTFGKLDTNGSVDNGDYYNRTVMVRYQFETC